MTGKNVKEPKNKKYLLGTKLHQVRFAAHDAHERKKSYVVECHTKNRPCWGELNPYRLQMDFWNSLTPEEFETIKQKLYEKSTGDNPDPLPDGGGAG